MDEQSMSKRMAAIKTAIDSNKLENIHLLVRSVNHDLRRRIIEFLLELEEASVTEIYIKLRVEQSVASQHLRILKDSKMVKTRRDGKFIYYSLCIDSFNTVNRILECYNDINNSE